MSIYFHYFVIIFLWKRAGPFIWTNLNPLHPRMLCAKFGWNWPSGSGEEDFQFFVNECSLFHYNLPLEKGVPLHLNKLDSLHPQLVCAKFGSTKFFLKFVYVFFSISILYPLKIGRRPSLERIWKGALFQVLFKLAPWFWGKRFQILLKYFLLFRYHLPMEKEWPLNKRDSS